MVHKNLTLQGKRNPESSTLIFSSGFWINPAKFPEKKFSLKPLAGCDLVSARSRPLSLPTQDLRMYFPLAWNGLTSPKPAPWSSLSLNVSSFCSPPLPHYGLADGVVDFWSAYYAPGLFLTHFIQTISFIPHFKPRMWVLL